ncbi:hypothetical protein BH18THE2_BH18THE2_19740 [soil metagenome]
MKSQNRLQLIKLSMQMIFNDNLIEAVIVVVLAGAA